MELALPQDSLSRRPKQVDSAISLMAVNVLLQNGLRTLSVVTGTLSGRISGSDVRFKTIDELVIWGFSIGLLALLWNGVNWARWLNLVLAILNVGLMAYRIIGAAREQQYLAIPISAVYIVLEAIALYLLFLSPGKMWFESRNQHATA